MTPSPHLKAPQPRVLATFVSTPFGVFLYGGARQVASTPNARAPLCDLWQLKREDVKGAAGQPVYVWEDCNKVPMCAVEHTVPAEDGASPPPATTAAAGVRVVVGHDAHASAFVEPSHLVVRCILHMHHQQLHRPSMCLMLESPGVLQHQHRHRERMATRVLGFVVRWGHSAQARPAGDCLCVLFTATGLHCE